MQDLRLELGTSARIRPWRLEDAGGLARHGDDPGVAANLRDAFPSPYRPEDARNFLAVITADAGATHFAIEVAGEAAGGIGVRLGQDVERIGAEIGYWLGREHWGKGIVTEAVRALTVHAFGAWELERVFALPFATNLPSHRVLEKAGYKLEGRMRRSAIKGGQVLDQLLYSAIRGDYSS